MAGDLKLRRKGNDELENTSLSDNEVIIRTLDMAFKNFNLSSCDLGVNVDVCNINIIHNYKIQLIILFTFGVRPIFQKGVGKNMFHGET